MLKIEPKGTAERIRDLLASDGGVVEFRRNDEWIVGSYAADDQAPVAVQGGSVSEAAERLFMAIIG